MIEKVHAPETDIENVGTGPFLDDKEVFLCSIAISLKRIADAIVNSGASIEHAMGAFTQAANRS